MRKVFLSSFLLFSLVSSLLAGVSAYTDDNTGEAYILETDRQVYHGLTEATVYLNLTNTRAGDVLNVAAHFPRESGAFVKEFSELRDARYLKKEPEYGNCARQIAGIDNTTGRGFSRNETYVCVKSYREVEVLTKDWVPVGLGRRPIASQRIPQKFAASEAAEGFSIGSGEKKQYRLVISFPIDSSGEFWIEAVGGKGYGLLDPWWSSNWKYYRQINITNNNATQVLKAGYTVNLTFNHSSLVNAGKSDVYGNDIRIDFNATNGTHIQLDRLNTTAFNTSSTVIWFKTVEDIPAAGMDGRYSLYYGSSNPDVPPTNQSNIWNPPVDENTILLYRLNEESGATVIDEKGSYNATWTGTSRYSSTYRKYGLYSGGNFSNSDYVSRNGISLPSGTVEAWIYPTEAPTQTYHCAFESGVYQSSHEIGFCIDTQTHIYIYQVGSGTLTAPLNQWTHVAVTWNGSVIKLYVNGQYDTSWSSTKTLSSGNTIHVGRAADATWGNDALYWFGYVDELRISNGTKTTFPYTLRPEPTISLGEEKKIGITFGNYQVTPSSGAPNATFNFSVNISNPFQENTDATLYVMNQTYDSITSASASLVNGSGVVTKSFQLNQSGIYFYHWYANSSNATGRGPLSGEMLGPTVATGNYTVSKGVWGSATRLVWRVYYSALTNDGRVSFITLQAVDPSGKEYSEFSSGVDTLTITVEDVNVTLPGIDYNLTRHTELKRIAVSNPAAGAWTLRALHGEGLTSFETQVKVD